MALVKVTYVDGTTVIYAQNLNDIQDEIMRNTDNIASLTVNLNDSVDDLTHLINSSVENLSEDVDMTLLNYGTNLEYDEDDSLLFLVNSDGERISDPISIATASGGGGGGGGNNAVLTVTNTTGWLSKTISEGSPCEISFTWSSIENDMPTGDGVMTIRVNNSVKRTADIQQGSVTAEVGDYLTSGTNRVRISVSDVYNNVKSINYTIKAEELYITSTFDTSGTYDANTQVMYTYTPYGSVEKLVHFIVDGVQVGTDTVTTSGRQQSYMLPGMSHGAHSLSVYFTSTIDGETVSSNALSYELVVVDPESNVPIISSTFTASTAPQYSTLAIPYRVYTPNSLTSAISLYVGSTKIADLTVDRTEQTWNYRCDDVGELSLSIATGVVVRTFTLTVVESSIDVEPETEALALYLTSAGRSNNEANPAVWEDTDHSISCTLTDFNFVSDGWLNDSDGITMLRVSGDARVLIPYKPFENDFRTTGKTIELEFATRNILNYDAPIISCMSGNRGFQLTAQKAYLKSEQSEISTQYKEDDHVRISFVAEKRAENRLLMIYINGIMSGVVQYPDDDDFSQQTPVNIGIGSNSCTTDIYCIRIYDNDLTRYQILDNWIADTQDIELMLDRFDHNNVYDEYGAITIEHLPPDLPYLVISCPQLPQYKGDKKTVDGYYIDPVNESNSFTFTGAQADVQGTSSQYYPRKNYKIKFNNGFTMTSTGETQSNYQMRPDSIPTKTFCYKADVASSEGANNVELVRLYNNICPYKTPPQDENPDIRQGIDGFPIVIFWDNGTTVSFIGKYNFNNDKGTPEVFGFADGDESWEIRNNTSDRVIFKSADFSGDAWEDDFEGRYPDGNTDPTNLVALSAWLVTTDRTAATGDALPESYTDVDGNVHTVDNAAYRLAKFKTELHSWLEESSAVFYYLFTELFLMVDSRAKNAFPSFYSGDKWCWLPYDMDTALGINNEGELVFDYSLEDIDTVAGGANVFNGQDSVMWTNLRDAFGSAIKTMYQSLRSSGALSYEVVETMFDNHQSKWPEAIFNEDSWYKYIDPLVIDNNGTYLGMALGSKAEQRRWWLYNRFRYIDSKYIAGDALIDQIMLRPYGAANISITPYADIYATVVWDDRITQERAVRNTTVTLICPYQSMNDNVVNIYSASQLASIGDLSGLYLGVGDFSNGTKLQSLKVGDSDSNYENTNLRSLTLGNNVLLQTLDVRNCSGLGDTSQQGHTQTVVDISGCTNIEYVYFDGTNVTGVTLPNGGILKTLKLPNTVTNLTVRNQSALTSFEVTDDDFSNVTTLRIENCSTAIPMFAILEDMAPNSRVRIIGFTMTVSSTDDVEDFYDFLDTMRGMDESGNNLPNAVASGTINGLTNITGSWLAEMQSRYPDITITYEHITSELYYYTYDGSTLLYTETINDGGDGTYSGQPTRTADAQYTYTFAGWSTTVDGDPDANATKSVTADRSVYAAYTKTINTYTVRFYNGTTLLQTVNDVPYGGTAQYTGATPVHPTDPDNYEFTGWNPSNENITGATDCYATWLYTGVITRKIINRTVAGEIERSDVTVVGAAAFYSCSSLTTASFPSCTTIEASAFYSCFSLTTISFPVCTSIGTGAFYTCIYLTSVSFPSCTLIGVSAFYSCRRLTTISFPSCASISGSAFASCYNLISLYLMNSSVCALGNSNAFGRTPIGGYSTSAGQYGSIYVPSSLLTTYQTATNWIYFSSRFVGV